MNLYADLEVNSPVVICVHLTSSEPPAIDLPTIAATAVVPVLLGLVV
jgi:hypothetical protein